MVFSISPWKGHGPSFKQILIPLTQGCFVLSLVEIGQVVLEKMIFESFQCTIAFSLCGYYTSLNIWTQDLQTNTLDKAMMIYDQSDR